MIQVGLNDPNRKKICASSGLSEGLAQYGFGFLKRLEKGRDATALASNQSANNQSVADISLPERRKGISKVCSQDKIGKERYGLAEVEVD